MSDHREKLKRQRELLLDGADIEADRHQWEECYWKLVRADAIREVLGENEQLRVEVGEARREWNSEIKFHEATTARIEAALAHCKRIREFLPDTNYSVEEVLDIIAEALQGKKP